MTIYKEKVKEYDTELVELGKSLKRLSFFRLLVFLLAGTLLVALLRNEKIILFFITLPVSLFCFHLILKKYNAIAYHRKHTSFLREINESEILRGDCTLEKFESGEQFIDANHPYTSDLDIFGQHSLFQLINRTTTESGSLLLSKWFSTLTSILEIKERQTAIKELEQKFNWRQDFQASGMHYYNKSSDYAKLLHWVKTPVVLIKQRLVYTMLSLLLPMLILIGLYLSFANLHTSTGLVYLSFVFFVFGANCLLLKKIGPLAEHIVETSTENLATLRGYRTLITKIEKETFDSKKLTALQSTLIKGNYSAYNEISRLCKLLDFSHQRSLKKEPFGGNQFYPLLNRFFLLDVYLILGTEKWKIKNKEFLKQWADVVSEFEVIASIAGFSYSNPTYGFPEFTEKKGLVQFEELGHPLLSSIDRVCNNYHSRGVGDVTMITGSNMGGKSTFLRTVGINLVLSLVGAPCCAKRGVVSQVELYTSMRTQDNLRKGISSFYAELNRIEVMLKLIESGRNVFFLLDEMFKGTNSEDRHRGGFSLIHQLSNLHTSGIIATHDIELAKLSEEECLVANYSFNSEIKEQTMTFSYKLESGICTDFNASELMRKSGINILSHCGERETGEIS